MLQLWHLTGSHSTCLLKGEDVWFYCRAVPSPSYISGGKLSVSWGGEENERGGLSLDCKMCNRGSACRWRNGNNYLQFSIDFFFNIAINRQHILAYLRMISPWTAAQGCSRFVSYTDLLQSEESLCLLRYFILKWRHEKKKAPSEKREITQDFFKDL